MHRFIDWVRDFLEANKAAIIDHGTDWVIRESSDLRGHQPQSDTRLLVTQLFAVQRALLMDEPDASEQLAEFIEFVTTYRARMNFHISTLLRGFLSFQRGLCQTMDERRVADEVQYAVIHRVDQVYIESIMRMSDVYVGKLTSVIEERQNQLQEAQNQLAEVAHRAGMYEVTSNLLHNVGNLLNSVSTNAWVLRDRLDKLHVDKLVKIGELLRAHEDDLVELVSSPQGQLLPEFVSKLAETQEETRAAMDSDVNDLQAQLDRIIQFIVRQHAHVADAPLLTTVDVAAEVTDALELHRLDFEQHGIEVVQDIRPPAPLITQRHKLCQILIGLLNNAIYALAAAEPPRQLTIRAYAEQHDFVHVEISDNGIGIASENLIQIFQHGFTTRPGREGSGLHDCAIAARELGGQLQAYSDGEGKGARFVLSIPYRVPEQSS